VSEADAGQIGTLAMRDGAELHYRHYAASHPRGVVVAVHGIRSHSGWYVASCAHLARAGFEVFFPDRRGSGLNRHARGDVTHAETFIDDLAEVVAEVRRRLPGVPVHLEAISWGAKLVCATLIRLRDLARSVMLVGPGLASRIDVTPGVKLRIALALAVKSTARFDVPLADARLFTDTPERVRYIADDPLSLRRCTARLLYATRRLDRFVRRHARALRTPMCVMLAGRDRIVDNAGVRRICGRFASQPVEIIEYPDAAHTLEFEPEPTAIFDDMVAWLERMSD